MTAAATQVAAACDLENWRYHGASTHIVIEGTTTCARGVVTVRAFDGKTYLGNGTGYITGYAFTMIISNVPTPKRLQIKYAIEPGR